MVRPFDGTASKDTVKKALKPALGHTSISAQAEACMSWLRAKVKMETTRTNPSGATQTVVSDITSTRIRKNPVSVSEFRTEMRDMFVNDPRRDFKVIDSPKAHSPAFETFCSLSSLIEVNPTDGSRAAKSTTAEAPSSCEVEGQSSSRRFHGILPHPSIEGRAFSFEC